MSEESQEVQKDSPELEETQAQDAPEQESSSDDAEYEAQLAELRSKLEKSEAKADNYKKALKKERGKKDEVVDESPSPDLETKISSRLDERLKELEDAQERKMADMRVDLASQVFEEELLNLSGNKKEQELMREHYRNSVKSSGLTRDAIRRDLQLCKAAANMHRIQFGQDPEGASGFTTAMSAGTSGKPSSPGRAKTPLSAEEEKLLKKFGVDPKKVNL